MLDSTTECREAAPEPDERVGARTDGDGIFVVEMLPARNGDALWIEYGSRGAPHRVLVDCGRPDTASHLIPRMSHPEAPHMELFVMTHIDEDHIGGSIPLLTHRTVTATFRDVWFNGWRQVNRYLSVRQGEDFSRVLKERDLPWNTDFSSDRSGSPPPVVIARSGPLPSVTLPGGMALTLLSPRVDDLKRLARVWRAQRAELRRKGLLRARKPEAPADPSTLPIEELAETKPKRDPSKPNGSSIAFLAEYGGRSIILTGDAHAGVIASSIKELQRQRGRTDDRLRVDALKLSHHGSRNGVTKALLDTIDCPWYLVSSNGDNHYHPDPEAIARVIWWGGDEPTLFFNYRTEFNEYWGNTQLKDRYSYKTEYPIDAGLKVNLMAPNRLHP